MPINLILFPQSYYYDEQVVLDGVTYTLEFRWSARERCYYLDIKDATEDPIVSGVKVVVEWPLAWNCTDERMFPGRLIAADTSSQDLDPALGDLGARVQILYYSAAELA